MAEPEDSKDSRTLPSPRAPRVRPSRLEEGEVSQRMPNEGCNRPSLLTPQKKMHLYVIRFHGVETTHFVMCLRKPKPLWCLNPSCWFC